MAQLAEGLRQAAQLDKLQLQRPQGRQMAEVEPEDMDADFRAELLLVLQLLMRGKPHQTDARHGTVGSPRDAPTGLGCIDATCEVDIDAATA